ncbi:wall-associated receptor kinase 5-like [Oryza brachyantha]|uniref:wall-associated receptor kinase 5-like n=1 Tax=Oryza brachyantha TaxID=4533 RepID=UPI001ADB513D|nr:wall-associated receptor kinase 5-like [Oryza brachyantha]
MTSPVAKSLWVLLLRWLLLSATRTSQLPPAGVAEAAEVQGGGPITLPGCPDKCGGVSIPYPFGTKAGCFLPGFQIVCNDTFRPPRPFLANPKLDKTSPVLWIQDSCGSYGSTKNCGYSGSYMPVEFIDAWAPLGQARVYAAFSFDCSANDVGGSWLRTQLIDTATSPFILSRTGNLLVGIGSRVQANLLGAWPGTTYGLDDGYLALCASVVNPPAVPTDGAPCVGIGCCQFDMPPDLRCSRTTVKVLKRSGPSPTPTNSCSFAMLVEKSWYNFSASDLHDDGFLRRNVERGVPVVLDFAIRDVDAACPAAGTPLPTACRSGNSTCANATNGPGYVCKCKDGYDGNPYIPDGCQDIDECAHRDVYPCSSDGICINRQGSYDCPCKPGWKGDGKAGTCSEKIPLPAKVAVGAISSLLVMGIVVFIVLLRKEKGKMRDFFIKNGGPTLEQVKNIKIYKMEDLKPILKKGNIVGKGFFGEVYKGHLENQLVAVKKPNNTDVQKKEQFADFANEVIIQSRIIHKNIVKLIGCCLEVDMPMLVYEFVSNGSLHDLLHGSKKDPLDLNMRLSIAAGSAEGLAYMHSKTSNTILHGDVKPANILLDDNFLPKISDFGISKLIAKDQEQHATIVVGDPIYMDPVYLQTGLLTKQSDVYSFGIVLLELISRKKATYSDNNTLVTSFLDAHKNNQGVTELFDEEIALTGDLEDIDNIVGIAVECLNLDVHQRPEMTNIAERLLVLKRKRNG